MSFSNFTKGDTVTYNMTFSAAGGGALDLTNHTAYLTLKSDLTMADNVPLPDVLKTLGVVTDAPGGAVTFTIESDDTKLLTGGGKYFYDVQIYDTAVPPVVSTTESGSITVTADVTWDDA